MQPILRRYFAFHRLFYEIAEQLPTDGQKVRLYAAICNYGFEKIEPDFADDEQLSRAWSIVLPDLSFNWGQTETGHNGGKVSAKRRSRAKSQDTPQETPSIQEAEALPESFPGEEPPTESFVAFMKHNGLDLLVSGARPLSGVQFRWLYDRAGSKVATALCRCMQHHLAKNGGMDYLLTPDMENRSIGQMMHKMLADGKAAFNAWLLDTFPKVANHPRPLTFEQYHTLRERFGRSNVLIKLNQLNAKRMIFKNARVFDILDDWISKSTECSKSSRYWLPFVDDEPQNAHVEGCLPGYDKAFDLGCSWQSLETIDGTPMQYKEPL